MYILVRSNSETVALAASNDLEPLKLEAIKDALKTYDYLLDMSWQTDSFFPYVVIPEHNVQYYIREIKYL